MQHVFRCSKLLSHIGARICRCINCNAESIRSEPYRKNGHLPNADGLRCLFTREITSLVPADADEVSKNRKSNPVKRNTKMMQTSQIAWEVYRDHFKPKRQDLAQNIVFHHDLKAEDDNVSKNEDFMKGYEAVIARVNGQKSVTEFRDHCAKMSEEELMALLNCICRKGRKKNFDTWSESLKSLFYLLDREICRRLNACYLCEISEAKDTLTNFETVLQIMLEHRCGLHCFRTYCRFCTYHFQDVVNGQNVNLLLLSILKIYYAPPNLFMLLEDFMFKHLDSLHLKTVALFSLALFNCNKEIVSASLLDRIGMKLLQHLSSNNESSQSFHVVNIMKILGHSNYSKMSFYDDLQLLLSPKNFNLAQLKTILCTYGSFKIYPANLIELVIKELKWYLSKPDRQKDLRSKDISRLINTIGKFGYIDRSLPDVYSICADSMVMELSTMREHSLSDTQVAMDLVDCVSGLLYVGKFHDGILDTLFGLSALVEDLKEIKDTDLLLIHNTVKLEYPEYKGRQLSQDSIDWLQQEVDKSWTIEKELYHSQGLQMCVHVLKSLISDEKIRISFILPYFKAADIELFLNEKNELVQPEFAKERVALQIIGYNKCRRGTDTLLGRYMLKLRQLKLLGYKIIMVYPSELETLGCVSLKEKQEFLAQRLREHGIQLD